MVDSRCVGCCRQVGEWLPKRAAPSAVLSSRDPILRDAVERDVSQRWSL